MEQQAVIQLKQLTRIYRMGETEVVALGGVDLEVAPAEFLAVIGASGSGKSTLLNIIGCLDRPTSGSYFLEGVDVSSLNSDKRAEIRNDRIGFVFQNFHLLPRTSALENVELPLIYSSKQSISALEAREQAMQALTRVGLQGREQHTAVQLSGGQQQRVAIARALINNPSILLADEPTGNLDTRTSAEVMHILAQLHDEGRTIVLITHENDIAAFARRVVTLRDGQIVSDQTKAA